MAHKTANSIYDWLQDKINNPATPYLAGVLQVYVGSSESVDAARKRMSLRFTGRDKAEHGSACSRG